MVDPFNTSLQTLKLVGRDVFLRIKGQGPAVCNILNWTLRVREGEVVAIEAELGEDWMGLARLRVHEGNVEAVLCLLGACAGKKALLVEMR